MHANLITRIQTHKLTVLAIASNKPAIIPRGRKNLYVKIDIIAGTRLRDVFVER